MCVDTDIKTASTNLCRVFNFSIWASAACFCYLRSGLYSHSCLLCCQRCLLSQTRQKTDCLKVLHNPVEKSGGMDSAVFLCFHAHVSVCVCASPHPLLKCQLALVFHPDLPNSRLRSVGGLAEVAVLMAFWVQETVERWVDSKVWLTEEFLFFFYQQLCRNESEVNMLVLVCHKKPKQLGWWCGWASWKYKCTVLNGLCLCLFAACACESLLTLEYLWGIHCKVAWM